MKRYAMQMDERELDYVVGGGFYQIWTDTIKDVLKKLNDYQSTDGEVG